MTIGDFQHVRREIEAGEIVLAQLGAALEGRVPGRTSADEVTVFDSSGISIQDLYVGQLIVDRIEAARAIKGQVNSALNGH